MTLKGGIWGVLTLLAGGAVHAHAQDLIPLPYLPDHAWSRSENGELRYLIPSTELAPLLTAAGASAQDADLSRIYFYDSCDASLLRSGIYLSARVPNRGESTLWTRMRPFDSTMSDSRWVGSRGFSCAWQWVGGRMVPSCTLERSLAPNMVHNAENGEGPLSEIFSEDQRSFMTLYGSRLIPWENLVSAGPLYSYRWEVTTDFLTGPLAIELWRIPTTMEDVLTVSTHARLGDLPQVRARLLLWLEQAGFRPTEDDFNRTQLAIQRQLSQEFACFLSGRPWEIYP